MTVCEVLDALFYVLSTGCQWPALPKDLRPKSMVHYYFMLWDWNGTLGRLHHMHCIAMRECEGREASPTAAIIDSQSARAAQKGLRARPEGYDAGRSLAIPLFPFEGEVTDVPWHNLAHALRISANVLESPRTSKTLKYLGS